MFDKVLIANRGEVAVRVIRACRDMGIKTVAVYSTADADALHVQLADEAYCIGGPRLAESYLNDDAVLTCAVKSGAKAIHPGYGFFSEKASFVRDCDKYGLAFVGPSAEVIDSMGDKDAARRTAAAAGVPIVPGCDLLKSPEEATAEAERIGCPVLIKARAGGGGRGIRKVERVEDAAKAFIEARAEGEAVFGDGECYMEKFVAPAHHVEVQIMADKQGHVFSLGERECSVQRRNQKLIEESPAPCLDGHDDIRARMHKAARDLARAVGYEGAGTIEFLYSDDGNFYFMEMNTRLQVEHPVTEFVTDTDLVKWQLRVAAGQPLPFEQEELKDAYTMEELQAYAAQLPAEAQQELMGYVSSMQAAGMDDGAIATQLMRAALSQSDGATYTGNLKRLGVSDPDDPEAINLFPKDFEAKDRIADRIAEYNKSLPEDAQLAYTDYIGLMISSITTIINAISYILIAFVAVSLVVSSIMIGIITYISVLERTREIGVLRSIGASRRDISRVFNAETLTIGFAAGAIGIGITLLLILPLNAIIHHLSGLSGVAALPAGAAVILVAISMLLTFLAGLIPSRIAAKKDPVIALRSE